ncbi:MAG: hypothetical protein ACLQVD_20810 [Capsulimonadaceae bacterium]
MDNAICDSSDLAGNLTSQDGADIYYSAWGQRDTGTYDAGGRPEAAHRGHRAGR